jgi:hypothetical protein
MLRRLTILAALAVLPAGCGGGSYKTAAVSGRVTLNGQPLADAAVMFNPVATPGNVNPGPGSTGVTDADGRYTLTIVGKTTKGAVVGKNKVEITMMKHDSADPADDKPQRSKPSVKIPVRYHSKDSKLECDVPSGGTDSANFDLTSP